MAADTAVRCCASRLRASGAREKQIFKCHARAAALGVAVDPSCIAAVGDALIRQFDRSECPAPSDGALVRADLERIVAGAASALRPAPGASACAARKLKAVARLASSAARAFSRQAPRPADHLGELDPTLSAMLQDLSNAFARVEARGGCLTTGDAAAVGGRVVSGPTPIPADGTLLVSLRLCPACGDQARGGAEQCDGFDAAACDGPCNADCSCPTCGDGVKNQTTEACDGADAAACAGLCLPNCTCPTPVCGNGVKESGEACDGADLGSCASCQPDCSCPAVCGNGVVEPSEQCDGTVCAIPGAEAACNQSTCMCCGYPCYEFGCCDPEEVCMPSPSTGYCFKFSCNQSESCGGGYECIDSPNPFFGTGKVCAGLPGYPCVLPTFGTPAIIPCVAPAICSGNCCSPAGEPCSYGGQCCSGTCDAGTCG